uniref:Uncharacterized protein n=1 Tax=Rhizophora mucronata TaxID=61149 RepID=A0A2P2PZL5_RHIMU
MHFSQIIVKSVILMHILR